MNLSNLIKAVAILSFSLVPVVTAFAIPIPSSGPNFSPRQLFFWVISAGAPDRWMANSFVPDPSAYYRLTNKFTGPNKALDVINDSTKMLKVHIVDLATYSGQFWRFQERAPGKYDLSTLWLGPNKNLDVYNDAGVNSTSVHLADRGRYSGQYWTITPWGDGTWRLTNDFTGPKKHLDVYSNTKVGFLGTDNRSGQHWYITKIT